MSRKKGVSKLEGAITFSLIPHSKDSPQPLVRVVGVDERTLGTVSPASRPQ